MPVYLRVRLVPLWVLCCFASLCTLSHSAEPQLTAQQRQQIDEIRGLCDQVVKLDQQGRVREAIVPAQQALAIGKALLGDKHPSTGTLLNNLGMLQYKLLDYKAARTNLEQSLAIHKAAAGAMHPGTANVHNSLGLLLRSMGDYAAARTNFEQALAIRRKLFGEKHPQTAESLDNLGSLFVNMGDFSQAKSYLEQGLTIRKELSGEKHPLTAASLDHLSVALMSLNDFTAARACVERALAIRKEVLGEKHPDTGHSLHTLGSLLKIVGDYTTARHCYEQSLAILNSALGERHPAIVNLLDDLGEVLASLGDNQGARRRYEQALAICKEVSGEVHPQIAGILNNLGVLLHHMGDYEAARRSHERSWEISKVVYGEKHIAVAQSLHNLASVLKDLGDYTTARIYLEQAVAIDKETLGEKHPHSAKSVHYLGSMHYIMGDYAAARTCFEKCLAVHKEVLGKEHPDTGKSLVSLASLEAETGNWQRSMELIDEERQIARAYLVKTLPGMADVEQLRFLQTADSLGYRLCTALAVNRLADPNAAATSAAWLINGKATAHEALAQQAILASEAQDPSIAESIKRLQATRRELANLAMTSPKPGQEKAGQQRRVQLESEEQSLAREVGRNTGRPAGEQTWIELDKVRQAIAPDSILVDVVRYEPLNLEAKLRDRRWKPARYAAWLIPAAGQGDVEIVDLGPAEEIESLVAEFREAIEDFFRPEVDDVLERLSRFLYKPIAARLASVRHWIVSPDGALWTVPWAALRVDKKTYAIERHDISYLVSSRDLVNRPARKKSSEPVVIADPDYALSPADAKAVAQKILTKEQWASRDNSARSRELFPKQFDRLPGTAAEAAAIEPLLQKYAKAKPQVFLQERALEAVVKNVHGPRVLVLSTHGFFLADATAEDSPAFFLNEKPRNKLSENPLLRCGLVLAGADRHVDAPTDGETDDGLLTGLEIVACDLRGTELAVLSACQTGLGDVHNGQGVAGLRQAFQLAGAECVMASLWEVPDQETAELMKAFFENLAEGQSKAVALGSAQRARIAWRRQQSSESHPWFWAAFTVTGR